MQLRPRHTSRVTFHLEPVEVAVQKLDPLADGPGQQSREDSHKQPEGHLSPGHATDSPGHHLQRQAQRGRVVHHGAGPTLARRLGARIPDLEWQPEPAHGDSSSDCSRIRTQSSRNPMPAASAAIGTRL